jgi:uncharacterized membrane protein YhaH (DUF805 family)
VDHKSFLFSIEGRINRARYWLASLMILCAMIFSLLLLVVTSLALHLSTGPLSINLVGISASFGATYDHNPAAQFPRIAVLVMTLAFGWRYAVTSIKRLHDRNKSAWWIVPFLVAPGLNTQFGDWLGDSWPAVFICYAAHIAFIWGFVEMYCLQGTRGPNRFGPDPLARRYTQSPWDQHSELQSAPHVAGPSATA